MGPPPLRVAREPTARRVQQKASTPVISEPSTPLPAVAQPWERRSTGPGGDSVPTWTGADFVGRVLDLFEERGVEALTR